MSFPPAFTITFAALFGAILGSFLNVCIYRLPRAGMGVGSPRRSHCPSCGYAIPWAENVPILSWLLLRGRCHSCRGSISPRYLLIEALTAGIFGYLAQRYLAGPEPSWALFLVVAALAAAGIVIAWIDQDLMIIPDEITLPAMILLPPVALLVPELHSPPSAWITELLEAAESALGRFRPGAAPLLGDPLRMVLAIAIAGLAAAALFAFAYRLYWRLAHPRDPRGWKDCALAAVAGGFAGGALLFLAARGPEAARASELHSLAATLLGMAAGSGSVLLVGIAGRQIFRKEAMGFGDVKLMGLLGGFTGPVGVLAGFFLACILGSLVGIYRLLRYRSRYLPFGPYLILGCLIMVVEPELFWGALERWLDLFRPR